MAEDSRTTQRNVPPAKSGVQVIKSFRSYFKSWRYETTSATGVVSDDGSSQVRNFSRIWSRQSSLETRETPSRRPTECIFLFPGWAVRRYHGNSKDKFDLHVHVSGYAASRRPTRGQSTLFRIAKRYAALHKVAGSQHQKSSSDPVPIRSRTASVDDKDSKDLLETLNETLDETFNQTLEDMEAEALELPYEDTPPSPSRPSRLGALDVLRLQSNLEERMELLLGHSMIPSRHVDLELFVSEHPPAVDGDDPKVGTKKGSLHPVGRHVVCTDGNGMFRHDFVINWDKICNHPVAHYQHGEIVKECELQLHANLFASSSIREGKAINTEEQTIPITHAPIRVISDIDDTIKLSNILGGARSVFRNVFVHDFEDIKIPGMSEWYNSMWEEGVRFHYVSNGPIQLLPLIKGFLQASKLPSGSIRLKAYGARSIFSDLLTPPADRKREGLEKILECFPDSKFILIGDSGEQDLELYAQVAQLRPNQILAVLVRDVEPDVDAIPDPNGKEWRRSAVSRKNSDSNSAGGSRSNSLFSSAIRDRLNTGRQKSWSSSLFNAPSFPPKRSATGDNISDAQDPPATSPTSPPVSEPEQINYGDESGAAGPIYFGSKGSPSNPRLSSSPLSVSILSQSLGADEGELSPSFHRQSHPNGTGSRIARRTTLETQEEENESAPVVFTVDQQEPVLSQSPEAEATGILGSTSASNSRAIGTSTGTSPKPNSKGISFNPTHPESSLLTRSRPPSSSGLRNPAFGRPSQHRVQTADEVVPTRSSPRIGTRPWAPRRNATTPSSETGTSPGSAASPLTSPSKLSLTSRYRGMSEGERKRAELQDRVWSARAKVPEHVVLKIFRHPAECVVEVGDLLKEGLVVS